MGQVRPKSQKNILRIKRTTEDDNDKKRTIRVTSDNTSTHPTLPQTLHAASMFYCEQLVDDLASLPTRKRKKKKTPRSDDVYAF